MRFKIGECDLNPVYYIREEDPWDLGELSKEVTPEEYERLKRKEAEIEKMFSEFQEELEALIER
jgi:hypothetical protein